jgi:hypothetical protein
MKKLISSKILMGILALVMIGALSSCLSNNNNNAGPVLQLALQLNGTASMTGSDTTLTAGNDSLMVTNMQVFLGHSELINSVDSTFIYPEFGIIRFSSRPNSAGDRTGDTKLINRSRVVSDLYTGVNFKVIQAPDSLNGRVPGIFYNNNGENYSMIIKGTYNDSSFTFKAVQPIDQRLSFTLQMPEKNVRKTILIYANVREWFLNNSGGFLDPSVAENDSTINAHIKGSFRVRTIEPGGGTGTM